MNCIYIPIIIFGAKGERNWVHNKRANSSGNCCPWISGDVDHIVIIRSERGYISNKDYLREKPWLWLYCIHKIVRNRKVQTLALSLGWRWTPFAFLMLSWFIWFEMSVNDLKKSKLTWNQLGKPMENTIHFINKKNT